MPLPKRWAVIVAGCTIGAIVVERVLVLYEPKARTGAAAEWDAGRCAIAPGPLQDDAVPAASQPGAIDPLGLSGAIRRALGDCP
jgi:hypothetical protein